MMNKIPIVALVLLLAGMALILNSSGILCPLAGDNSSCKIAENCNGICGENRTCHNDTACAQNISSEENCSELGSCPVKVASVG